jgi:hypothetical protein
MKIVKGGASSKNAERRRGKEERVEMDPPEGRNIPDFVKSLRKIKGATKVEIF